MSSFLSKSSLVLLLAVLFSSCSRSKRLLQQQFVPTQTLQKARGFADDFDNDDDDEDDRELVYARRSGGRRGREEGAYYDEETSSSGSKRYQDNVEFFDLDDDDDMFEDDFGRKKNGDLYEETYNGIIPNPLVRKISSSRTATYLAAIITYYYSYTISHSS